MIKECPNCRAINYRWASTGSVQCNNCLTIWDPRVPDDDYDEPEEAPSFNPYYSRSAFDTHAVVNEWFKDWPGKPQTVYYLGDALKYIQRAGHKEGEPILKDLKKALDYITKAVALEENKM